VAEQPRVDFYILAAHGPTSRLAFACRLSEKAYKMQTRVYAHASSDRQAEQLDQLLWTFRDGSFVPHERVRNEQELRAPVAIGTPEIYTGSGELLINLCDVVPTFSTGFSRIAEIVPADDDARAAGRKRFKQYRDLGLEPTTHTIE
jgi:DNA polymerase-3 subunit chi